VGARVRDDSRGFWRRMRLIPFTCSFPVNATLSDELRAEAPGILAWAVRGCRAWQREGLTPPQAVVIATNQYERDSDQLAGFLDDACDLEMSAEVGAAELFDHYKRWAERHGLGERERLTATMFGRKLTERFESAHKRAGKVYKGLALRMA
jgi:putative DNA primase/helicase